MKAPTAGIILAAGESKRFGQPKQLLTLGGRRLIEWPLAAALSSNLGHVVLVLGCEHERIRRCLGSAAAHPKCEILVNPGYRSGQSTSLRAGIQQIKDAFPSAMFLLGDQPLVDSTFINLLLERATESDKDICIPTHRGTRGTPALFGSPFYPALLDLAGDTGARDIIRDHPLRVLAVEVDDPFLFRDIDRPEDIAEIAHRLASRKALEE